MSRLAWSSTVLVALLLGAEGAVAQKWVELDGWDGRAQLIEPGGPGIAYFRLDARADWSAQAPRDASRFEARVTLPDGRTIDQPVRAPQGPGSSRQSFFVPQSAVLNVRPDAVVIQASVVDRTSGAVVSDELRAGIDQFPHPGRIGPDTDEGPFHWGRPLEGEPGAPRPLARRGPGGLMFLRIPASDGAPGFYLATAELTNAQARRRLAGYDPDAGRSDDFQLSAPAQPALNLTPRAAQALLRQLTESDGSGVGYRLPTREEWLRAAKAGRSTAFWWGDEAMHPEGANFLGPEPALQAESTAPASPNGGGPNFEPNPWGLYHTFGNVAEWATTPEGGFVRMGGNFRTEPASPLPEVPVQNDEDLGPDPYVGVRPAFDLDEASVAASLKNILMPEPALVHVDVAFNPETGVATLSGPVPDAEARRLAASRMATPWFVSAVSDELTLPSLGGDLLVEIGPAAGKPRRTYPLGRVHDIYTFKARWAGRLPVAGSTWYVNVYSPGGQQYAHVLPARDVGRDTIEVVIDHSRLEEFGLPGDLALDIGISLGVPARLPTDPSVVSNLGALTIRTE
jgi:hypothetical protein